MKASYNSKPKITESLKINKYETVEIYEEILEIYSMSGLMKAVRKHFPGNNVLSNKVLPTGNEAMFLVIFTNQMGK